ncbi:hypothetical protein FHW67_000978 [Herbaspirillum sp. Sphag1AN]|uniref:hypothetical protein n=1 Tax=unclassified Herbaspirillum TaxID=2624150 RepID=UPI0016121803|nr:MULTISPECIES: hypothetical protein [unclassified Herbaspirillum]MBB3211730.1 hypothetical protein [Herbaspirillum sp. Sphag1AN]MBB3245002.1 hypothetical protein [Herbaspirillum sp. Sphag64]
MSKSGELVRVHVQLMTADTLLFANGNQQVTVQVKVEVHLYRDGSFFMRALTPVERDSIRLRRWSEQLDDYLPDGWFMDYTRNDYDQGVPGHTQPSSEAAATRALAPENTFTRYLRASKIDTQRFMVVVDIEGYGSVTSFATDPGATISSMVPLVIPAQTLLRRDQLELDQERADNARRQFLVSYFDFPDSRMSVHSMRFYTGIVIPEMPSGSRQFYRRDQRFMGGVLPSVVYLTPRQIVGRELAESLPDPDQELLIAPAAVRAFMFFDSETEPGFDWVTTSTILITDNFGNPQRYILSELDQQIVINDD